jgi:hypothetical protein
VSFRERVAMRRQNSRWAYVCRSTLWAPIGRTENDVIAGRLSSELRRYIGIEVANQPPFDRAIVFDDLEYAVRSRALVLRAVRNPQGTASAQRDLLWPSGEDNETRFDVSRRDEKQFLGSLLVDLLVVLPTTPAADIFDNPLYRTRRMTAHTTTDHVAWAHESVLSERFTEEIRSNWGDVLAFVDSQEPRRLETSLSNCELGVVLAAIQRVADVGRAIELVRYAPAPVAIVALAMLTPGRGDASRPTRSITEAYDAFQSGRPDADARLERALAERADEQTAEERVWNDVIDALFSRRDLAAPLAVLGSSTEHPIARAGFEQALAAYADTDLCSAIDAVQGRSQRGAGELMLLKRVTVVTRAEQAFARTNDIGKALGTIAGALLLFDPVDAGRAGLELHLNAVASESAQDIGSAMRSLAITVDATIQLLDGRYVEVTRDAKNGALGQVLGVLAGLEWVHQHGSAELKNAAPNLVDGITELVETAERLLEWFDSLDISEQLMSKIFESAVQAGDARLIDRLKDTLRRAFCFGETIQSWPGWLPKGGEARSQLVRAFHREVLHDHGAYFVGAHRFDLNTTPDALRPFLEVDCEPCERLILERLAALPNRHSDLRGLCTATLAHLTADAVRCAATLRSYPLVHESWRRFRDAIVVAAERLVPEIATTEARTAWARQFEEGLLDRTSLLASEVACPF